MTIFLPRHLNKIVLSISLFLSQGLALADSSITFDEIVKKFDSAFELDMELFASGKNSSMKRLFRPGVESMPEPEIRRAAMQAYERTEDDRKYFQLAALLFSAADSKASLSWLHAPNDTKELQKKQKELRAVATKNINSTRAWKGYSAFQAANDLSHLTDDNGALGPSYHYHYIASTARIQRSYLSLGYLNREYRLDNPDHSNMWGIMKTEEKFFLDAANCTPETMADDIFPYQKKLCEIAYDEHVATMNETDKIYRPGIHPDAASFFGLIGLVGLAIIENAKNNPSASYSSSIGPIQGPSAIETHLWLNPGG